MAITVCFFFQAEDGIRDGHVTGVQTCALPISRPRAACASGRRCPPWYTGESRSRAGTAHRSEERRVGKECRRRRPRDRYKKKRAAMADSQTVALSATPMKLGFKTEPDNLLISW